MSTLAEQAPPVSVVAAILAGEPEEVSDTLAAIELQVYGPHRITVVGREADARALADKAGVGWRRSLPAMLDALGPEASHVWLLRAGAVPRPGALQALVQDSERAGSPLAGSKVLDKNDTEVLVSVGIATDVFAVPYRGLDTGEVDAGQYDVVRDVASVDGVSTLLRRDLAKGLGGFDPLLAPQAAAIGKQDISDTDTRPGHRAGKTNLFRERSRCRYFCLNSRQQLSPKIHAGH